VLQIFDQIDRLGDELHRVFMQHLDSRFAIQCESCGRFRGALPIGATLLFLDDRLHRYRSRDSSPLKLALALAVF
jgi:hypothetical protein